MFKKLDSILTYYDSEPTELTHGFIWLIGFPIIYTLEHGFNTIIFLSMIIGFSTLYSVTNMTLRVRKTIASAVFLFSIISVILFFSHGDYKCPSHWGWVLIALSAFFNLKRIANHYYRRKLYQSWTKIV